MIIDAINENDALSKAGPNVLSIEESRKSIERNKSFICQSPVIYEMDEPKSPLEQQVDRLIIAVNQTKNISAWERRFAYGLKRHLKEENKLSGLQKEKFQELYRKVVR